MAIDLKKKAGPLPVWGWIALAGGGIGVIYLVRRKGSSTPSEPEAVPTNLGGAQPEVGGAGGGGGIGETKSPLPEPPGAPVTVAPTSPVYEPGGFAGEVRDVLEGKEALERLGLVAPAGGTAAGSSAGAPAAHRVAATGGNPRAGIPFKATHLHGQAAHEYAHAVPGGVGPGHRFIILPVGKKNHSKKPSHAPAHAKGKPAHHTPTPHHAPAPAKHPATRRPAPKPKAKRGRGRR